MQMVRREIEAYKRFKAVLSEVLDLSIQDSRSRCSTGVTSQKAISIKSASSDRT